MAPLKSKYPAQRVTVVYRVEAGLLGPEGEKHLVDFCAFAQFHLQHNVDQKFNCLIEPRFDKTLCELSFQLKEKKLSNAQVSRYFNALGINLDDFQDQFENDLEYLINQYLQR